ncbi:hypothetical protein [uncultured Methanobacterium sp.]|uniref:hypothetical protein n=1 Tax=uncultured Methanobacterium sp. TaxID=176306 RepID=UPI002AA7A586|nr:hypothetical protein [uncultured Methanobacterium sp.]
MTLFIGILFVSSVSAVSAANSTNTTSFTPSEIANASVAVQKQIETNDNLPNNVTIGNQTVSTAQYLHLATEATSQLQNNNNTPITLQNDQAPKNIEEQLNTGTLTKNDYLDFAQRLNDYMNNNQQAPPYGYIGPGKIGYQSQVYLFARILAIYNSTGSLPLAVTIKPFTPNNIPIPYTPPTTFTPTQIIQTATNLQNIIETTKTIPNTVTINGTTINTAQFLHLAITAITQLKNNNNNPILLKNDQAPSYTQEQLNTGTLTQNDYLDFAQRLNDYMNNNQQAAPYGLIGPGKIGYQSQVYLFTRILTMYNSNGTLPTTVTVKAWTNENIPIKEPSTTTVTIAEILSAAQTVKTQIETNEKLPNTITIGTNTFNMAQFLYMATQATILLNNGKPTTTTIKIEDYSVPTTSSESLTTGTLNTASYVDFANRITEYIQNNKQAPPYGYINQGQISYQSQVYLFTRILTMYNSNGTLPTTVTVKAWTNENIPIKEPSTTTVTIAEILSAAQTVKTQIETNEKLPNTITIGTNTFNMAQFLYMATQATILLNNGKPTTTTIKIEDYSVPTTSSESLTTGTLNTASYVDFANRITEYIQNNKQAPPYGYINQGQISYQSQVYLFTRILTMYNSNGTLPTTVTVKAWTNENIPIVETPTTTFTPSQIAAAAAILKTTIESTKTIPSSVIVGGKTVSIAQFLHLATQATVQLNNNDNSPILLIATDLAPSSSVEDLVSGVLFKDEYVDLAQRISNFMNGNSNAPAYGLVGLGKVGYQSQVYLYSRILSSYNTNHCLPDIAVVKSWCSDNIPLMETPPSAFTLDEILASANSIESYMDTYKHLPSYLEVANVPVNMGQYLYLITMATVQLKNKNTATIALQKVTVPSYSEEQLTAGTLSISEYVDFAQRIVGYINQNHQAPPYGTIGLGKISYQSQIYLFNQILATYYSSNSLPATATVKSLCKPIWITSDRISDSLDADYNRLNAIVALLRSWGADANVFGVGPDTQNAVLRSSSVQDNALVVDIYGGACAGTIYAMAGSYYQGIKGSREVYSIWTTENGGWDINNLPTKAYNSGVNFLPRAHDDTFSTYLPDWGYNSKHEWTDGLNNPDQFMTSHGFDYLVCNGDITQMATAIFNEART